MASMPVKDVGGEYQKSVIIVEPVEFIQRTKSNMLIAYFLLTAHRQPRE